MEFKWRPNSSAIMTARYKIYQWINISNDKVFNINVKDNRFGAL